MTIISVVSPDQITPLMFVDYVKSKLNYREVLVIEINNLFSHSVQETALEEVVEHANTLGNDNICILIKYKVKRGSNFLLNEKIRDESDLVIKFDRFSQTPEIIKDSDEDILDEILLGWEDFISAFDSM